MADRSEKSSAPAQPKARKAGAPEIIELTLASILAEKDDNVRYFKDDAEQIRKLAKSIEQEGVVLPLIVTPAARNGKYQLVAGFRRLAAAEKAGLRKVPCIVKELDEEGRLRVALTENIQRRNLSPMEIALNIKRVRGVMAWEGEKNTAKVAQFMAVSPATVTQHEKLLDLAPELQRLVHERVLGAQAGQDLATYVVPEMREKVVERAVEVEAERQEKKEAKAAKSGKKRAGAGSGEREGKKQKRTPVPGGRKAAKGAKAEEDSASASASADDSDGENGNNGADAAAASDVPATPARPSVSQSSLRKAARELKAGVGKLAKKISDWVEMLEVMTESESEELKEYAEKSLAWQKGEIEDGEYMKYMMRAFA